MLTCRRSGHELEIVNPAQQRSGDRRQFRRGQRNEGGSQRVNV